MSKGCAGIKILEKGIVWRNEFLSGISIQNIASKYKTNAQIISRAIWLAKIPDELKLVIKEHPEIFTREILINQFAAKRNLCAKNSFKLLYSEVLRMKKEGMGSKPKFPRKKSVKKDKKEIVPNMIKVSVSTNILEAMSAEKKIKDALGFHCRVVFHDSGASQITINLNNKKDLETFIRMVTTNTGLF